MSANTLATLYQLLDLVRHGHVTFDKGSHPDHHAEKCGELPTCTICMQHSTKTTRSLASLLPNHILPLLLRNPLLKWPIRNISETNNPLTDEEEDALRTAIVSLEAYIAARSTLPAPKTRPRLCLVNSNDIMKIEHAHLKRLRGRLSIVHSLPPEILQEIFIMGADVSTRLPLPGGTDYSNSRTRKARFGFKVAHVSRYWRNTALSTPKLWSCLPTLRIEFEQQHINVCKPTPPFTLYEFMVKHSRGCSLDISIDQCFLWSVSCGDRRRRCTRILDLLLDSSDRWRVANLDLQDSFLASMGHRIKDKLSQLELLHLKCCHPTWSPFISQPTQHCDVFSVAPKLRHVLLFFREGTHIFQLPQTPLFTLVVQMDEYVDQTALVNCAFESHNSVERLELYSVTVLPRPLPHNTLFSRLQKLHIDNAFEGCLNAFTTPSLEELVVFDCPNYNAMLLRELLDMLQRSDAASTFKGVFPLKRLTLMYPVDAHDPELIIKILEHTPHLQYLDMALPTTSVLSRLAELAPSPLLPELQHLIFRLSAQVGTYSLHSALNVVAKARCEKLQCHQSNPLSVEPIKVFMLLGPYRRTDQRDSEQEITRSYYALEDAWDRVSDPLNMPNTAFGPSSTIQLPTKAAHLPEWAKAIDRCCPGKKISQHWQAKVWIAALRNIQWHDIDTRCYEYSRLFKKLDDVKLVLSSIQLKTRKPAQHISDLAAALEPAHKRWKCIIDTQLPKIHWVIQYELRRRQWPDVHALLYIPQHNDEIRSRLDARLMVDITTSLVQEPLRAYYYNNMFYSVEDFYALRGTRT